METLFIENFLNDSEFQILKTWLYDLELFSGTTKKGNNIDRKQKWFHITGGKFNSKWAQDFDRWKGYTFPSVLKKILDQVNGKLESDFNSCLVNYYEDGRNFIPKHVDSISSFGLNPIIANLSVGATRKLKVKDHIYSLQNNSLFVMSGPSTEHELLKDPYCVHPRWSLTFRKKID